MPRPIFYVLLTEDHNERYGTAVRIYNEKLEHIMDGASDREEQVVKTIEASFNRPFAWAYIDSLDETQAANLNEEV